MSDSSRVSRSLTGTEIAIVGMAGRFPGARNVDALWRNLRAGVESIRRLDPEALAALGVPPELAEDPDWVPAVSQLDGYVDFDAAFFGINPREAELMDPQHRVLLELAWQALEDAGHAPDRFPGPVGVFAGSTLSTYLLYNLARSARAVDGTDPLQLIVGNAGDTLATRISYKLDLKGPSHTVQSACSTSLVAVHLACRSLLDEECDLALAGGISVNVAHGAGYRHVRDSILSPDGHCRPFAADAAGTLFGSGAGLVVLRRLDDALADGDRVRALILGSAVNNDGAVKVGFTAPSVEGQAAVISEALEVAGVDADSISYVEAHGTGTALGDPVEVQALTRAFRTFTDRRGFCALGSVKSNLGHLDIAAGVAGLIKTVLAMEHREIPPSLHCDAPNPKIDFASSPVYVARELAEWPNGNTPRRAGVSSFGLGGTNVHVVLEEAPEAAVATTGEARPWELLTLSAKTPAALEAATGRLAAALRGPLGSRESPRLADVAYTLHVGRSALPERRVAVCRDPEDAAACLDSLDPARVFTGTPGAARPSVLFLFPGQGAQHPGMGSELYATEPVYRAEVNRCLELLSPAEPTLADAVRRCLLADPNETEAAATLAEQPVTQTALFVVEHALSALWMSWGVVPRAMLGHSIGEYAAAVLAGVLRLEDALAVVAERGRLMAACPAGAMLSVSLPEAELTRLLRSVEPPPGEVSLALAAVNAPEVCTVSGTVAGVEALAAELARREVRHRRLHVSVGAHGALMEPARRGLVEALSGVRLAPPEIPLLSNVTGAPLTDEQATDPEHWGRQLCSPVRFADGLGALLDTVRTGEAPVLLEVGPGRTLSTLAGLHPRLGDGATILTSLRHPQDGTPDGARILDSLGRLWTTGLEVDWEAFHRDRPRRRVPLPTYPFERRRCWVEPDRAERVGRSGVVALPGLPPGAGRAPVPEEALAEAPREPRTRVSADFVEPRTDVERAVAGVWGEVLGVERVGAEDNFYDLGGHSLLATQVASRLRELFAVDLSVERVLEGPTVSGMTAVIDAELAAGRGRPPAEGELDSRLGLSIPRRAEASERAPLSFAQERMWFLQSMDQETSAYNLLFAVDMEGRLDLPALAVAFRRLRARHRTLSTTFTLEDGRPVQVLGSAPALEVPVVDLTALPAERHAGALRAAATAERARSFDLERGPLFRLVVLRSAPGRHVAFLTMHHIVSDGWSMGVLVRETAALYEALAATGPSAGSPVPSPLAELPIEYADYAAWQRETLSGEALESHVAYWREQLAELPGPLELTTDRPRARAKGFEAGLETLEMPGELRDRLEALSRERGATLFMVLLAAFQALLYRVTGADDLVLGAPIAGRNRAELEGLIGFFLNTLVLRTRVEPEMPFSELLERTRRTALGAYAHQDVPVETLLRATGGGVDRVGQAGIDALFRVMFLFQNVPHPKLEAGDLTLSLPDVGSGGAHANMGTAVFDLCLGVEETDDGLATGITYNRRLFDPETVTRLLERYRELLGVVVSDPERPLALMGLAEGAELDTLRSWSRRSVAGVGFDTVGGFEPPPVVRLLVERAAETPDAPAVIDGAVHLSYRELVRRVDLLARRLRAVPGGGIGIEDRVALSLERSPEMIVAVLGVLAAGGAYVPIDPAYPAERRELILDDCGARAVVTSPELAERWRDCAGERPVVEVAAGSWRESLPRPRGTVEWAGTVEAPPEAAAYLIYTSGSTGRPKGVVVDRRSLAAFTAAAHRDYGIGPGDRVLQFASISFDTSAEEIYPTLTSGGTLVLRDEEMLASPGAFLDACVRRRVTVIDLPTAYWHELAAALESERRILGPPARLVILGGERALPERLAGGLARFAPSVRLLNTYGPTETTVAATASAALGAEQAGRGIAEGREAPIGRPLAHATAWVVDPGLRPVPVGVPGELVLGGPGVARGYLGRPASTAARFVPAPAGPYRSAQGGERLYRTGDKARWLPSGELQFLGRIDQQVKIRGFRVEPGEVETVLRGHPGVADAVVAARVAPTDERQAVLCAWVVESAGGCSAEDLRVLCEDRLPAYMVPGAFVFLDALPLTPSGKVDRRALPDPDAAAEIAAVAYREPETDAERAVAAIFADVLGVPRVGADDDFFHLGGHSLLLPRVLHRVREAFQVEVPLKAVYDDPTVEGLALAVEDMVLAEIEALEGDRVADPVDSAESETTALEGEPR